MRLTLSPSEPYRAIAADVAQKFAEFAGARADAANRLKHDVGAAVADLASAAGSGSIDLQMARNGHELVVTTSAGSATRRSVCALPD